MAGRKEEPGTIVVVGAGLVGAVASMFLGRGKYKLQVYERATDPRTWSPEQARSINLTMSPRGQFPLRELGLEARVLEKGMLAQGRVIHVGKGNPIYSPYNEKGEGIVSLKRTELNAFLIDEAEANFGVEFFFQHEFISCDYDTGEATFKTTDADGRIITVVADLIIGADGAHSAVRDQIFRSKRLDYYEQKYHDHGYMELVVPAGEDGKHQMDPTMLHIWPRNEFMLITFPNLDGTFSGTLFMPFPKFEEKLSTKDSMLKFFRDTFPDLVKMTGEQKLIHHFIDREDRRPSRLVSNKSVPYHTGEKVVFLGDAAHAMVPFFGQGMNAGFEDCSILNKLWARHNYRKDKLGTVLKEFSENRCKDGHSICDMAFIHYEELKSAIAGPTFYMRKFVDNMLFRFFPKSWVPQYTMVAFTDMPYSECQRETERQKKVITWTLTITGLAFFFVLLGIFIQLWQP